MKWLVSGIHCYDITEEQQKAGGAWVCGDTPNLSNEPTYPGKNNGQLKVKRWYAFPDKYAPGVYPMKSREDTGEYETVIVGNGSLTCQFPDDSQTLTAESQDLPMVVIEPNQPHRWELPPLCQYADGATILSRYPAQDERNPFTVQHWNIPGPELLRITSPFTNRAWSWQIIIVLQGEVTLYHPATTYALDLGSYRIMFIERAARDQFCLLKRDPQQSNGTPIGGISILI